MVTVKRHTFEMLVEKQSKFIAHLMPYNMYDAVLAQLKLEHPKARHFVTAFRYVNAFNQVVEGSSDDGEPKGTSGKPTLSVLQGQDLINVAVVVVRYFGGTKLGTGGLVRAYSDATNLVVASSSLVLYEKHERLIFSVDYSDVGKVDYMLETEGITNISKTYETLGVRFDVQATQEKLNAFTIVAERMIKIEEN